MNAKGLKFLSVFIATFSCYSSSASDLQFIGKCSWDVTFNSEYRPGHALAEFFLDETTDVVYVHNYIDQEGGDFYDVPEVPDLDVLQEAGVRGVLNFQWDEGASRINFEGHPLNKISRSTNSFNSLGVSGNIYAPCLFIQK